MPTNYGTATEAKIGEAVAACQRHGARSIVALSGVPGTGKSFVAGIAAQRLASDPLMVREIQFHPTFSYEEFIEGYRATASGGFAIEKGLFLEWNDLALDDPTHKYVLLIEELTRANLPAVLGELMTYVEHRDRTFTTVYSRRPIRVAENILILATLNPRDRSALELDDALLRRLRLIPFPPDNQQLREMLNGRGLATPVLNKLASLFDECRGQFGGDFDALMPFGHGMFSEVSAEAPDLFELWKQRISPLLNPPGRQPHPFAEVIEQHYPWRSADARVAAPVPAPANAGGAAPAAANAGGGGPAAG
ncbi:MAG: AAA family ATPase [Phycisphaerales bacterium]|nr:AAA family ATPase [Phycisphaerales bacterium]